MQYALDPMDPHREIADHFEQLLDIFVGHRPNRLGRESLNYQRKSLNFHLFSAHPASRVRLRTFFERVGGFI